MAAAQDQPRSALFARAAALRALTPYLHCANALTLCQRSKWDGEQAMVRIAAIGDNVVDCYVSSGLMYPGGNTLNVSAFAQRFGANAAYVGVVGDDPAGRHIIASLRSEGVDVSHLRIERGATAYCIIGHDNGDRVFVRFDLGVSMFAPTAGDLQFLAEFDAAHVGRSSGLDPYLAEIKARTKLSYDFSTRRDIDHIAEVAPGCFLAACSGGDLSDSDADALQRSVLDAGAEWVLVTKGQRGASITNGAYVYTVPAVPVSVVDTLGAGDTFTARTLVGLIRNEAPADLLYAAAEEAAKTCLYAGAIGHGIPVDIGIPVPELTA